jgi:hypothetical protein
LGRKPGRREGLDSQLRVRLRRDTGFLGKIFKEGATMSLLIGSSNSVQSRVFGDLHRINNQLFRITLLADILINDVKKSDSINSGIAQMVEDIRSAAFDVARTGKALGDMLQQCKPLTDCVVSEPLLERLSE